MSDDRPLIYGLVNFIKGKNGSCKSPDISAVLFLICQVICYSVIEETAHVIGKSQSMRGKREQGQTRSQRDGDGDEAEVDKLDSESIFTEENRRGMDGKGINLKEKFDSYPHIVYDFISCPLSCYTDISAHPKAHSATVTKKQDHAAPAEAPTECGSGSGAISF